MAENRVTIPVFLDGLGLCYANLKQFDGDLDSCEVHVFLAQLDALILKLNIEETIVFHCLVPRLLAGKAAVWFKHLQGTFGSLANFEYALIEEFHPNLNLARVLTPHSYYEISQHEGRPYYFMRPFWPKPSHPVYSSDEESEPLSLTSEDSSGYFASSTSSGTSSRSLSDEILLRALVVYIKAAMTAKSQVHPRTNFTENPKDDQLLNKAVAQSNDTVSIHCDVPTNICSSNEPSQTTSYRWVSVLEQNLDSTLLTAEKEETYAQIACSSGINAEIALDAHQIIKSAIIDTVEIPRINQQALACTSRIYLYERALLESCIRNNLRQLVLEFCTEQTIKTSKSKENALVPYGTGNVLDTLPMYDSVLKVEDWLEWYHKKFKMKEIDYGHMSKGTTQIQAEYENGIKQDLRLLLKRTVGKASWYSNPKANIHCIEDVRLLLSSTQSKAVICLRKTGLPSTIHRRGVRKSNRFKKRYLPYNRRFHIMPFLGAETL